MNVLSYLSVRYLENVLICIPFFSQLRIDCYQRVHIVYASRQKIIVFIENDIRNVRNGQQTDLHVFAAQYKIDMSDAILAGGINSLLDSKSWSLIYEATNSSSTLAFGPFDNISFPSSPIIMIVIRINSIGNLGQYSTTSIGFGSGYRNNHGVTYFSGNPSGMPINNDLYGPLLTCHTFNNTNTAFYAQYAPFNYGSGEQILDVLRSDCISIRARNSASANYATVTDGEPGQMHIRILSIKNS